MNIVVCVKQVPDTWAEKKLEAGTKTLDRESADNILNEMDEFAIEEALRIIEAHGGSVTVLSMGPDSATEAIRKALSMGADSAVHVCDDALKGSDSAGTSLALAKAVERIGGVDLVIAGSESSDSRTSVVPAMLAERLGHAAVDVREQGRDRPGCGHDPGAADHRGRLPGRVGLAARGRVGGGEDERAAIPLVQGDHGREEEAGRGGRPLRPRYRRRARSGLAGAWTSVADFADRPPRSRAGTIIDDDGDGGVKLVEFLAAGKFV